MEILRLVSIYSLVEGGIKAKYYDLIRKEIVETYGFEKLSIWNKLVQSGFISSREAVEKSGVVTFKEMKKSLKLVSPEYRSEDPGREGFPYLAYTPVTVKLLENAVRRTWLSSELVQRLPGVASTVGEPKAFGSIASTKRVIVLYMIGGVTQAEAACLRHTADTYNIELLIATTSMITSKSLLRPFIGEDQLPRP